MLSSRFTRWKQSKTKQKTRLNASGRNGAFSGGFFQHSKNQSCFAKIFPSPPERDGQGFKIFNVKQDLYWGKRFQSAALESQYCRFSRFLNGVSK
jgi:hypothetical protein